MDIRLMGEQIMTFRKAMSMTQEELGRAVGVSTQAVSRWENGGAPDVSLLPAIADKLGVTIDALFGREEGEVRDMTGTLAAWLRSKAEPERMRSLSRLIWESSVRSMMNIHVPEMEYPKEAEQEFAGRKSIMRTAVCTDDGYVLGVAGEDLSYMCVFPEPEEGYERYLLEDSEYRALFAALSLPGSMELLRYFCGEGPVSYIVAPVAAKRVGRTAEETARVLEALTEVHILRKIELELENGMVSAYEIRDINAVVPFLYFARWLSQLDGVYFMNMGFRERPSLKPRETKNHEKK